MLLFRKCDRFQVRFELLFFLGHSKRAWDSGYNDINRLSFHDTWRATRISDFFFGIDFVPSFEISFFFTSSFLFLGSGMIFMCASEYVILSFTILVFFLFFFHFVYGYLSDCRR